MSPRVFISHASEDKPRFVMQFAQRLRENGVDAWLDNWEMQPGDSFVDRIFEHGLKEAQAVVTGITDNTQLAQRLGQPQRFVNYMLDVLEQAGHIQTLKFGSGVWEVAVVSPMLKRSLE